MVPLPTQPELRDLPVAVCGSASTNTTSSGIHHLRSGRGWVSFALRHRHVAFGDHQQRPFVHFGCARPIAAAPATPGQLMAAF
jgi:hypothetical protein